MIPYWPQPVWSVGPLTIHAFGLVQAVALTAGFALISSRARQAGLDDRLTGWLFLAGVVAGLATGAVVNVAVMGTSWRSPGESAMGVVGGALVVAACAWLRFGSTVLAHLDAISSAAPVIGALARFGCFLAHDHRGRASTGMFAVRFPEGPRIDIGLVECVAALAVAGPVWWLWRSRPPAGILTAALLLAVIAVFIGASFLR